MRSPDPDGSSPLGARSSLSDRVYDYFVGQLSLRKFKIGARINARQVTDDLSVSRTTANKALERLAKAGWIKMNEQGGAIVASYPPKGKAGADFAFNSANQTDSTYEIILERILRGDVAWDEIIKERPLAGELGVNPATVRRAAEWLRNDGLLARLPRRGWRVDMPDPRDVMDIYKIRLLLEPLAMIRAVHRLDVGRLDELERETDRLIASGEKATAYERRKADHEFHMAIAEASGSRILAQTLDSLVRKVLLVTTVGFRYGRVSRSFEEHKQILGAVRERNPDEAVKRLKNHLNAAMKLTLEA